MSPGSLITIGIIVPGNDPNTRAMWADIALQTVRDVATKAGRKPRSRPRIEWRPGRVLATVDTRPG